jgi:hypothetical protein
MVRGHLPNDLPYCGDYLSQEPIEPLLMRHEMTKEPD